MRISGLFRAFTIVCVLTASSAFAQAVPERAPIAGAWGPNDNVADSVVVGDTIFLGGQFDYIGPRTGPFATADAVRGANVVAWNDIANDTTASTSDGSGGWFVLARVGAFGVITTVRHVRADGTTDPAFASPTFNIGAYGLSRAGTRLYVHGYFTQVNGQAVGGLAAFDTGSGALLAWAAQPTYGGYPATIAASAVDGGVLYVAGYFDTAAGQPRRGMAAFDAATGALLPATFDGITVGSVGQLSASGGRVYASGSCQTGPTTYRVICAYQSDGTRLANWGGDGLEYAGVLLATPARVYIAGFVFQPGSDNQHRVRGFDPNTGAPDGWQTPLFGAGIPAGYTNALAVAGTQVLVSGSFPNLGNSRRLAGFDTGTGALTSWQPAIGSVVTHLATDGTRVAMSGSFRSAGGRNTPYLAALDLRTGLPAAVTLPSMPSPVQALASSGSLVVAGSGESIVAFSGTSGAEYTRFPVSAPGKPPGTVFALAIAEPNLFVGGNFVDLRGQPRRHLGAIDMRTGQATAFDPQPDNQVYKLRVSSGAVYAVGAFQSVPGYGRAGVAAWDVATGALETFSPRSPNAVDLAFYKDRVMVTGFLNPIATAGTAWVGRIAGDLLPIGRPVPYAAYSAARTGDTIIVGGNPTPGYANAGLTALDAVSGNPLPWAPALEGYGTVNHVQASPSAVVVAGNFTTVDGAPAHNLAIFPMSRAASPRQMTASVNGNTLTLGWQPGSGPAASGYVVEVGTSSGGAEVGAFPVGSLTRVTGTLPAGTFYTRVRGTSAQGTGAPGSEVVVTTPSVSLPPQAPSALSGTVANGVVMLSWSAAAGNATTYVVEAGTGPGLSNIGALPLGHLDTTFSTPAPPGTYVVRVRAANAFGVGPASNEITIVVP